MKKYSVGQIVWFVQSGMHVKGAKIINISGDFCTIRFEDGGGIRVRSSKLYSTKEDAEQITKNTEMQRKGHYKPYW